MLRVYYNMSYSPALEYFCQRLEGLSVGQFRLETQNQGQTVPSQSIIRVNIPTNALVDIRSFSLNFSASTGAGGANNGLRLPDGIEKLVNRVEVSIGGVSIASGCNYYNVLCQVKKIVDGWKSSDALAHNKIIPTGASYVDNQTMTGISGEVYTSTNNMTQFAISNWCGFIGECEPRILSTDLFGDMVITIYLEAPNNCISTSEGVAVGNFTTLATAPNASYSLSNVYATITCYSMASGEYDNVIASQLQSAGSLEVGFKQYFSFREANFTSIMRFTVATQSLNRLFAVFGTHGNDAESVDVSGGTAMPNAPLLEAQSLNAFANNQIPSVLDSRLSATYRHPYTSFEALRHSATAGLEEYQWTLNSALYPQYKMRRPDVFRLCEIAGKRSWYEPYDKGLHTFNTNDFVVCAKFTMDAPNSRYIQGLDTRSVALNAYLNVTGNNAATNIPCYVFCECDSSLLIAPGRQIEIIQ